MSSVQRLLTCLALLVPIALIAVPKLGPSLDQIMPPILGTYDVLLLAAALPKEQVRALLPKATFGEGGDVGTSQDVLAKVPDDVWQALQIGAEASSTSDKNDKHVVLLQMGYQRSTGPGPSWLPKMSFGECKLEVPFVRHPQDKTGQNTAFVYKQHMLMDNALIMTSSSVLGLTSSSAHFEPSKAPLVFAHDSDEITYKAGPDYLDAHAKQLLTPLEPSLAEASSRVYSNLMNAWWFGARTGETVQKFDFDMAVAEVKPTPYDVTVDINLRSFAPASGEALGDSQALPAGSTRLHGLGWRVRAPFVSRSDRASSVASR